MVQKYKKLKNGTIFPKKLYFCNIETIQLNNFKLISDMKAFVNDTEVRTYYGAKVKSVVLAYCRANNLSLKLEGVVVKDAYGNVVDLDGALRANSRIYVKWTSSNL